MGFQAAAGWGEVFIDSFIHSTTTYYLPPLAGHCSGPWDIHVKQHIEILALMMTLRWRRQTIKKVNKENR